MAEAMFRHVVQEAGLEDKYGAESAGIADWHVGEPADSRMSETAGRRGVGLTGRARQFKRSDFDRFDLIVAMDRGHQAHLLRLARGEDERRKIRLMREFDAEADGDLDVPDPYYGGQAGFDEVYEIIERSSRRLLRELEK
jgi:protein-tyrosine phosphatase